VREALNFKRNMSSIKSSAQARTNSNTGSNTTVPTGKGGGVNPTSVRFGEGLGNKRDTCLSFDSRGARELSPLLETKGRRRKGKKKGGVARPGTRSDNLPKNKKLFNEKQDHSVWGKKEVRFRFQKRDGPPRKHGGGNKE